MPYCADGCYFDVDADGRLSIDPACSVECLMGCFEIVDVPDNPGHYIRPGTGNEQSESCGDDCLGVHFGSEEQWPKRYDTHYIFDNANRGYHNDGDPLSDDPTFLGSSTGRAYVNLGHETPVITGPSALDVNDPTVETYAATSVQFENTYGCPVIVMVEASNWYHDLANLPISSSGGARWTGEARVRVRDSIASPWQDMEWQRTFETILMRLPNEAYHEDALNIRGKMTGPGSFGEAVEAMFDRVKYCLGLTASELKDQFGTYTVVHDIPGQPGTDVAAPLSTDGYSFPFHPADLAAQSSCNGDQVGGADYNDYGSTYGDPRSGGRSHRGQDIMGPEGADVRAVIDGTISLSGYNGKCGYRIRLEGADGIPYTYCHLQAENLAPVGTVVTAGQKIGQNGHTGNAWAGCAHIHFEMHNGDVNPHDWLTDLWNNVNGTPGGTSTTDPETGGTRTETVQNTEVKERAEIATACANALDTSAVQPAFADMADAIVLNDYQLPDNTSFMDRLVKTGGSWQIPILLRPGQGILAETRSRFSRWSYIPMTPTSGTFFDEAGGSARSGKITMTAFPMFGGSRCDEHRFADGPWYGQSLLGAEDSGTYGN